jgi:RNA polymerase sigma factor (sigma-70 family)
VARTKLPPFQAILDQNGDDVFRFLVATVGLPDAEDCFQDTFLAALRAYPGLRDAGNLRAWLFTIAHRKVVDSKRAQVLRPEPAGEVVNAVAAPPEPALARASGEAALCDLWESVRDLPAKQRIAVAHRFINDLAYREIGALMGTTEEAARRNVHEAVKRLREVHAK